MRVYHFLVSYVLLTTMGPAYYHAQEYGSYNMSQAVMSFFLGMNFLVCIWEIGLGINIDFIYAENKRLTRKYRKNNFGAVMDFFAKPLSLTEMFTLKYWASVWSTYSLYDPSYANRESFGFFVDVGNGWTTLVPTLLFQAAMTIDLDSYGLSPLVVGVVGILSFYQEFYGTVIYFLSFFMNKRHMGKGVVEVLLFVGLTNGIWFFCPLLGMSLSYQMIRDGNYACVRA